MAKADIELLFGVAGGGSPSGESGKKIQNQLNNIINNINKTPLEVEIAPSKGSVKNFQKELSNLTAFAMSEAQKIKAAYSGISLPQTVLKEISNSGKSGGTNANAHKLITNETQMLKSLAQLQDLQIKIKKIQSDAQKISNDSTVTAEGKLAAEANALKEYESTLRSGTMYADDFAEHMEHASAAIEQASKEIKLLGNDVKSVDFSKGSEKHNKALIETNKLLVQTRKNYAAWTAAKSGSTSTSYEGLGNEVEILSQLHEELKSGAISYAEYSKRMGESKARLSEYSANIKVAGKDTKSLSDKVNDLISKFSRWFSVSQLIMGSVRTIKEMARNVTELDTAMTELRKVTDETEATYNRFLENAATRAKALGATLTDTVAATANFAKLGKTIPEATELADAAIVYKNVGDGLDSIDQASASIISTMQAFGEEAGSAMDIVDRLNEVGNKYAITSTGIGDALQRSSAAMHSAGNTLDETIALITAANTIVQNPDSVGTTMKTISMYLRAAKTEAEEAGESTEGMAGSMSELRNEILKLTGNKVDIQIDDNQFKSTYEILKELSAVWDQLTDISKANILEMIGGKRNANVVSALLEDFEIAEKALKTSMDASGSALAENEKYLNSIEGKLSKFRASWQALSAEMINSDFLKIGIESGRIFVDVLTWIIDQLGGFGKILVAIPIGVFASKIKVVAETFDVLASAGKATVGLLKAPFESASAVIQLFTEYIKDGESATSAFKKATDVLSTSLSSLAKYAIAATVAFAAFKLFDYLIHTIDRLDEELVSLKDGLASVEEELSSLESESTNTKKRLEELYKLKENGPLTFAEEAELELLESQNKELERKIQLLQIERDLKQNDVNKTFTDVMRGDLNSAHVSRDNLVGYDVKVQDGMETLSPVYDTEINYINKQFEKYKDNLSKIAAEEEALKDEISKAKENGDIERANALLKQQEEATATYEAENKRILSYLNEKKGEFEARASGLSYIEGDDLTPEQQEFNKQLSYIEDFVDRRNILLNIDGAKTMAINRLTNQSFADVTEDLRDIGKEGKVTADILGDPAYSEFVDKCIELGIVTDNSASSLEMLASWFNEAMVAAEMSNGEMAKAVKNYTTFAESVTSLKDELAAINSAASEQGYLGNLSPETYNALIAASSDYSECIEYQNGALQLNTEKANALFEANSKLKIAEIELQKIAEATKWKENAASIKELTERFEELDIAELEHLDALKKENKSIEDNLVGYDLQIAALEDLTSAYGRWKAASASDNSDNMYKDIQQAYEQIKEAQKTGQTGVGNVVYQAAVKLLVPEEQEVSKYMSTLKRYITEGSNGLTNFINDMVTNGLMERTGETVNMRMGVTMQQICDTMKITPEMAKSIFGALEMYDFNFDWTDADFKLTSDAEAADNVLASAGEKLKEIEDKVEDVSKKAMGDLGGNAALSVLDKVYAILEEINGYKFADKTLNIYENVVSSGTKKYGSSAGERENSAYWNSHASGTKRADAGIALVGDEYSPDGSPRPELIISNGKAYVAGKNGPEFVKLKTGDQVLTADETKRILRGNPSVRRSSIPAFAGGTKKDLFDKLAAEGVSYEEMSSAMTTASKNAGATISGGGNSSSLRNPGGSGGGSGGSSSSSSSSSSSTKEKSQFEKDYEAHQHLLAMEKESYEEYLKWLAQAYQDAYNKGEIELEDYRKYAEEVFEGQKELFQDSIEDIEHKIKALGREPGNEREIINHYNRIITKIDAEIAAARARGLNDDDDYIQELLEQKWDYADEIADIEEEITENAKDAVDELVDYRVDMLRQEIEDHKDALNDKLDALKDFYDEQKQMLQDSYDEEKYLEEQNEKRRSVSDIKDELDQLRFDNSAAAEKRKLELQEELKAAEKDLSDFEKDKALQDAMDLLDKQYEQQEKDIQSQIDELDAKLNDPNALFNQALSDIKHNTAELYGEMVAYNNAHGDGNPETIKEMYDSAKESLDQFLKTFGEAYKDILLVGSSSSAVTGYASGTSHATKGVHELFEGGKDEYVYQTKDGHRYKMFSGLGDKVLNASATDFLYKFANNGEAFMTNMIKSLFGSLSPTSLIRSPGAVSVSTGDIVIQGNADSATVSEIRRAQRENVNHILREFVKLNR